jgi:hypothetical protein
MGFESLLFFAFLLLDCLYESWKTLVEGRGEKVGNPEKRKGRH